MHRFDFINQAGYLPAGNRCSVRITAVISYLAFAPGHGGNDFFKIGTFGFDCQAFLRQFIFHAADRIHDSGQQ